MSGEAAPTCRACLEGIALKSWDEGGCVMPPKSSSFNPSAQEIVCCISPFPQSSSSCSTDKPCSNEGSRPLVHILTSLILRDRSRTNDLLLLTHPDSAPSVSCITLASWQARVSSMFQQSLHACSHRKEQPSTPSSLSPRRMLPASLSEQEELGSSDARRRETFSWSGSRKELEETGFLAAEDSSGDAARTLLSCSAFSNVSLALLRPSACRSISSRSLACDPRSSSTSCWCCSNSSSTCFFCELFILSHRPRRSFTSCSNSFASSSALLLSRCDSSSCCSTADNFFVRSAATSE
mmetsp:Transcript_50281/g.157094  ORF Transcript_50281/g.157094 Transcript_50281/m.157094 type:complete len:295 (-) Transcript_50281:1173-2057(-)